MQFYYYSYHTYGKLLLFAVVMTVTFNICGCMTQNEKFTRLSPEEIKNWSDENLCINAYRVNPLIRNELLSRKLVTEGEFDYLYKSNVHNNFPRVGMPKCAMWTFTNSSELLSKKKIDGISGELWKVHKGEYIISKKTGGSFYLISIEDGKISSVEIAR